MTRPPIPDWVLRGVLQQVAATWDVVPISQTLVTLMRADPLVTLARAEAQLRVLGSHVHLVAIPAEHCPPNCDALLLDGTTRASSYLWVCLYGAEEARSQMAQHGMDASTNQEALRTCGFLTMREEVH